MAIDTAILIKVMTLRNMDMSRYNPQDYLLFNHEEYDATLKSIFTENIRGIPDTDKTEIITDHINICRGDGKHNVNWRNVIEDIINYANHGDDKNNYEYWSVDRFDLTIAMQKLEEAEQEEAEQEETEQEETEQEETEQEETEQEETEQEETEQEEAEQEEAEQEEAEQEETEQEAELSAEDAFSFYEEQYSHLGR
jgi:flagellar biosynthesis GTPase FlhF